LNIVRAKRSDVGLLYQIILDRSRWLKEKGIVQWDPPYPVHRFQREIEGDEVYFFQDEGEIVGTVTLLHTRPEYYPANLWRDSVRSWYVCRLATSPVAAGRGCGKRMLHVVETEARLQDGMQALRLDVVRTNPFLRTYYEEYGFRLVQEGESHGTPSLFFEKRLR
jgi:GNAT superfamily N-acetyltransferase